MIVWDSNPLKPEIQLTKIPISPTPLSVDFSLLPLLGKLTRESRE